MLSMTGYASLTRECDAFSVQIDIKSVNGKYSDLRLNASAFDNNFLETLRKCAAARTVRGQVTVDVALKRGARVGDLYRLDISQLEQYQKDYEDQGRLETHEAFSQARSRDEKRRIHLRR